MDWKNTLARAATIFLITFVAYVPASAFSGDITWNAFAAAIMAASVAAVSFIKNTVRQYRIARLAKEQ